MIKRYLLIIAILASTNIFSYAQKITNSPYSFFGIGDIDRNGFNNSVAMGGLSTGLRASNQINYMNPAAISSQDTMSFIFDIGINSIFKNMKTTSNSADFKDFNFDHLAISFPIKRWWFASLGITPYSKIGYDIKQTETFEPNDTVNAYYDSYGNGGINQVFLSNSFKILDKLAVGFNLNYLFGSIEQYNLTFTDISTNTTIVTDDISLKNLSYDIGLQYYDNFSEKYFYVIGVAYSSESTFNTKRKNAVLNTDYSRYTLNVIDYLTNYTSTVDTVKYSEVSNYKVKVPARFSFGFTAGIEDKLTVGMDYSLQDWSNIESIKGNNSYSKDETFNLGMEYIPEKYSIRNYYKRINYRAGMFLNNSYLNLNGEQIKNYGITFGLGFPIANGRTSLNISYTYGKRGTTNNNLIEENYSLVGINLTLYDFWFIKRKFQ